MKWAWSRWSMVVHRMAEGDLTVCGIIMNDDWRESNADKLLNARFCKRCTK